MTDKTDLLFDRIVPEGMRRWCVLELGCFNGRNTIPLAGTVEHLLATDGREDNVGKTWVAVGEDGLHHRVRTRLMDARDFILKPGDLHVMEYDWGPGRECDLIFHSGVLYHLQEPARNLAECCRISPRLWLDTHVAPKGSPSYEICADNSVAGRIAYMAIRKPERVSEPKAGLDPFSRWLPKDSLLKVLSAVGYTEVEIINERQERHGPRITIYARRPLPV